MNYALEALGVLAILAIIYFYKYIKKYLIPYEISEFKSESSEDGKCYTGFIVIFQEGYLIKKRFYRLQGHFYADRTFTKKLLNELLSLTERRLFHRSAHHLNPPVGMFFYSYKFRGTEISVTYSLPS